jgi:hypothetical protein
MATAPIIPASSFPLVIQSGQPNVSLAVTAPFDVPHPTMKDGKWQPYNDYEFASNVIKPPMSDYAAGFAAGWQILTGGAALDLAAGKAAYLCQEARKTKSTANKDVAAPDFGTGRMDVWRLLVEKQCDVDEVIKAM